VFTGNSFDAIDFFRESENPDRDTNPLPSDQRVICGNLVDNYSDADPETSCPTDIDSSEGIGHLGGDSPWDGEPVTKQEVFNRDARATYLDTKVEADSVPTNTEIEAVVTLTNSSESDKEVVLRLRVAEFVLTTETVSVAGGEEREVTITSNGIPDPEEVTVTRNGQKIGYVRVN
jgi:hypothetical protein